MEIVSSLDHVNELYIVMAGYVELIPPAAYGGNANALQRDVQQQEQAATGNGPVRGGVGGSGAGDKPYGSLQPLHEGHSVTASLGGSSHGMQLRRGSAPSSTGGAAPLTRGAAAARRSRSLVQRVLHKLRSWHPSVDADHLLRDGAQMTRSALSRASQILGPGPAAAADATMTAPSGAASMGVGASMDTARNYHTIAMPTSALRKLDTLTYMVSHSPRRTFTTSSSGAGRSGAGQQFPPSSPKGQQQQTEQQVSCLALLPDVPHTL